MYVYIFIVTSICFVEGRDCNMLVLVTNCLDNTTPFGRYSARSALIKLIRRVASQSEGIVEQLNLNMCDEYHQVVLAVDVWAFMSAIDKQ